MTLDLFPETANPHANLLPYDGIVSNFGRIFTIAEADRYFEILQRDIPWRHDEAVIFGKHIITAREVAWYGDTSYNYGYSGANRIALPWDGVFWFKLYMPTALGELSASDRSVRIVSAAGLPGRLSANNFRQCRVTGSRRIQICASLRLSFFSGARFKVSKAAQSRASRLSNDILPSVVSAVKSRSACR